MTRARRRTVLLTSDPLATPPWPHGPGGTRRCVEAPGGSRTSTKGRTQPPKVSIFSLRGDGKQPRWPDRAPTGTCANDATRPTRRQSVELRTTTRGGQGGGPLGEKGSRISGGVVRGGWSQRRPGLLPRRVSALVAPWTRSPTTTCRTSRRSSRTSALRLAFSPDHGVRSCSWFFFAAARPSRSSTQD